MEEVFFIYKKNIQGWKQGLNLEPEVTIYCSS